MLVGNVIYHTHYSFKYSGTTTSEGVWGVWGALIPYNTNLALLTDRES